MRSIWLLSCLIGLLAVLPASAQQTSSTPADQTTQASAAAPADPAPQATTPPTTPTTTPTPASTPTFSAGPIDFVGTLDGYYNLNFNHPLNMPLGDSGDRLNTAYNFDTHANQFGLNLAKIGMSHQPDPVGFEFDLAYGDTMKTISFTNALYSGGNLNAEGDITPSDFDRFVEQAFIMFKPMKAKGFEIDFGKFNTTAGAEVIETYNNWNYSRSLLFSWAIPYDHTGVRLSWPMGKHFTGGFQLVNGWNNVVDNNSGKTIGANIMATYTKWNWMFDYYGGPENADTNKGWRSLYDTTFNFTASPKWAAYINYDYGQNHNYGPTANTTDGFKNGSESVWDGIALAFHYMPTAKWSFTPRYEWYQDRTGYATLGIAGYSTVAVPVTMQEFTFTGEYKIMQGMIWRAEYRYDTANKPIYTKGSISTDPCFDDGPSNATTCPTEFGLGNSKNQSTLTIGFVVVFGPKP